MAASTAGDAPESADCWRGLAGRHRRRWHVHRPVPARRRDGGLLARARRPRHPRTSRSACSRASAQICETRGHRDREASLRSSTARPSPPTPCSRAKGARVGLLITEGWAHLLHLAESWTPGPLFGFFNYVKPEPLVDYEDIREVPRAHRRPRRGAEAARRGGRASRRSTSSSRRGVEAITVCLLNSYANAEHEQRVEAARARAGVHGHPGLDLLEHHARVPRVRARRDHGHERLRRPGTAALPRRTSSSGCARAASRAPLQIVRSDGGLQSARGGRSGPSRRCSPARPAV